MILYCCNDLLWASKVRSTADAMGIPARPARDRAMLLARLDDSPVRGVLLDLEAAGSGELLALLRGPAADPRAAPLRVIAFGPHVEAVRLAEAARAGVTAVFARGALVSRLPGVLQALASGATIAGSLEE